MARRVGYEVLEATAAALLALTLVVGSLFVWIGVPLAGLWIAGEITKVPEHFLLFALCAIPTSMVLFGWLLYRLNSIYVRMRPGEAGERPRTAWLRSSSDAHHRARTGPRPLIDVAMAGSAWLAVVLMAAWFFFFAEQTLVSW